MEFLTVPAELLFPRFAMTNDLPRESVNQPHVDLARSIARPATDRRSDGPAIGRQAAQQGLDTGIAVNFAKLPERPGRLSDEVLQAVAERQ